MNTLKPMLLLIGLLMLLPGLAACGTNGPDTASSRTTASLLVRADGAVEISRQQWAANQWSPVSVGALVADADLLAVQDGNATLLCPDWSVQEMTGGPENPPCPRADTARRFRHDGYEFRGSTASRGPEDTVPYILYPRQALILDDRPLLRWHDTGATSYRVAIEASGEPIWSVADVTGIELRYPDTAPALETGKTYQLVVQDTDTGRSSLEDSTRGTGFRLASEEERAAIAEQQAQIAALDELDDAEQQLAIAVYLISQSPDDPPAFGYWGAAWLRMEEAAQVHDTPTVWRWQGEALRAMRLPNEAEQAYQRALQQAEAQGNREEQAAALAGLWYLTDEQDYFDEAIRLYDELGAREQAEALREAQ
jgi:hypothetical protein